MRIVVTGAAGFVGTALVTELLARGHEVHALVRNRALDLPPTGRLRTSRIGDLNDSAALAPLLAGSECVIHLAARVHHVHEDPSTQAQLYEHENTLTTMTLARTALAAGIERFVFMSSIKALGERSDGVPLKLTGEPMPGDPYGRSKRLAEEGLIALGKTSGLRVAIVRAPLVYGPGAGANFRALVRFVRRGLPLPFGAVRNRRSMVGIRNLCDLLIRVSADDATGIFHAADEGPVSTPELCRYVAEGLGVRLRLWNVSPGALRALLKAVGRGSAYERLCGSLEFETADTNARLRWAPPESAADGIARAAREMRL